MLFWAWKRKLVFVMRLTLSICLLCVLQSFAIGTFSQNLKLSIKQENISVESVIQLIEDQTDYYFMYSGLVVDVKRTVDLNIKNKLIPEILDVVFKNTDVTYKINGRLIALNTDGEKSSIFFQKENITISGRITDSSGVPLPGVTVVVKGTNQGTVTNTDGSYLLANVFTDATLIFSFVGMKTQEIPVAGKTSINVVMEEDAIGIEEVIAVGYGTQKKINLTGAVSAIKSDQLEKRPVQNLDQALQGLIPGMNLSVDGGGGMLDNSLNLNIRGTGTIGEGSNASPLVLIDGIESDINMINPQDVDNISVLKDAASSAIYGSRAAFGVILITTKSGKKGKFSIRYDSNIKFNSAINLPEQMDSYTFATYVNRAAQNSGMQAPFTEDIIERIIAYQKGEITTSTVEYNGNWATYTEGANANNDIYETHFKSFVPSFEENISISGGNEKITYFVSGNYLGQNGLLRYGGDHLKRYSLNSRFSAVLSKTVSVNYSSNWIRNDYDRPSWIDESVWENDYNTIFFGDLPRRMPVNPRKDPNGYDSQVIDIIQMKDYGKNRTQNNNLRQKIGIVVEPIENWFINADGNMSLTNKFSHVDILPIYYHDVEGTPHVFGWNHPAGYTKVTEFNLYDTYLNFNLYSDFSKQFKNGHFLKTLIGFNGQLFKSRDLYGSREGIITPSVPTLNTATDNPQTSGGYRHWSTAGFFGRFNYNYKEKYLFEINGRYDGSSRFIGENRWGFFPSISLGWNIAKEDFFNFEKVNSLKLRTSWGQLGNANTTSLYPFALTVPIGLSNSSWLVNGVNQNTSSAPGMVSSSLTWERVESYNIGIDFMMLKNRLTGSFDYFNRLTKGMVGPAPELPSTLGTSVPRINNTDMKSKGWELELMWKDRINDFSYSIRGVLSDDIQKILKYPNEIGNFNTWYKGKIMGEIWGYETKGIAKTQEEMDAHISELSNGGQSSLGGNWTAGDIMYIDKNGDEKIDGGSNTLSDPGDLSVIGNSAPRLRFGLTITSEWKGFDLNLFFQGVMKRDYALPNRDVSALFWGACAGMWNSTGLVQHQDYFRPEGDPLGENLNAYYPRPLYDDLKNHHIQTRYLLDASYIRLKNIQIGYTLPAKLVQDKVGISSARIYISGENIWTGTKLTKIFDPENLDESWGTGMTYPLMKSTIIGVSINF